MFISGKTKQKLIGDYRPSLCLRILKIKNENNNHHPG
jgi:hypothetical protein